MPGIDPKLFAFLDQIPDLPESYDDSSEEDKRLDEEIKARRRRLRDAYGWGLASDSSIGRRTVARQAAEAVTDSTERQWLIEEVADIAKKKEWTRKKRRAEKGYLGRFVTDIQKPAQAMGEAAEKLFVETPSELIRGATGRAESAENVRFFRALEGAKLGEAPFIPEDAPFTQEVAVGGAGMIPGVLAGAAAFGAAGAPGAATFWAASEFPESREDFLEAGLSPPQAALAGGGVAAAVGATEAILPIPGAMRGPAGAAIKRGVAGATGKLRSLAAKKGVKALHPQIGMAAKRIAEQAVGYGVEVGTEGLQEMEKEIGLQIAGQLSKDVKERPLTDVPRAFGAGVKGAAPGMLMFAGGGAAMGVASGVRQAKTERSILKFAAADKTPSRAEWRKMGLDPEMGRSSTQRKEITMEAAEDLRTSARARAVADQTVPTAEEWKLYGFPPEAGRTREQRTSYLAGQKADMEAEEALARAEAVRPPTGMEVPPPGQLVAPPAALGAPRAAVPAPDVAPGVPGAIPGIETGLEPEIVTGPPGAPRGVELSPWEASPEALGDMIAAEKATGTRIEEELFGKNGAKRYRIAQSTSNNLLADREKRADADRVIERMEGGLTESQRNYLFGVGEAGLDVETLKEFRKATLNIDAGSEALLGESVADKLVDLAGNIEKGITTTEEMNLPGQLAVARINQAMRLAQENNYDWENVWKAALRRSVDVIGPENVELLEPFLRGQAEAAAPLALEAPRAPVVPEVTPRVEEPSPVVDIREVERKGPLGDFIEDTKGRIGVSVKSVTKAGEKGMDLMRRFLTSKGELPSSAFEAKVRREGRVSRIQKKIAFAIRDYEKAIKKAYGTKDLSEQKVELLDAAFRGEGGYAAPGVEMTVLEGLPLEVRKAVAVMRMEINALSRELIDIGAVQDELVAVVSKGIEEGSYLHRSYKAFDVPGWAEQVPAPIRNRVTRLLRSEHPDKTEAEIKGLIAKLLYEGKAAETPLALIRKHSLGEGDLSIFKRRTLESPEIRALLGEHKDPRINYARSMTMMGEVIANHRFLDEVRDAGLGTFLSEVPIVNEHGELKTRIAKADETSKIHPLRDLYTTPEIKRAFEQITEKENQPEWVRIYLSLNAKVKIAKTILSQMTHVRNTVGNIGFAVANGHWRAGKAWRSARGVWTGLFNRPDVEYREYYLRAVELGLIGQDVHSGELRANMKDAMESGSIDDYVSQERQRARKVRTTARKGLKAAVKLYQAEDDIWKLFAWENEKARYRKARPDWDKAKLEQEAATIVRNTYPTYSLVPEGVKALRRFPVVGNFVSFPAEVIRTSYHTLAQAGKELQDPRTRDIGATRFAGFAAATIGFTAALKGIAMFRGVSSEDDEDMRYFVPPWQKNSVFFHRGYDEEKKTWGYIDFGYSDPHNLLQKTFMAFLRGENFGDRALDALVEIAEPFLGEEILIKKLTEVQRNDTEFGKVYNEQDDFDQKAKDVLAHTWKAFEPGGVVSLRRIGMGLTGRETVTGRAYDPMTEIMAMSTGQRFQDLDVEQSLKWRASDLRRNLQGANRILYDVMMRRGSVGEGELTDAYQRSDRVRRELYNEAAGMAKAAINLHVESSRVQEILKEGGATVADLRAILYDGYVPFQLTVERMKAMRKANPEEYESRKSALLSVVESVAKEAEAERIEAEQAPKE